MSDLDRQIHDLQDRAEEYGRDISTIFHRLSGVEEALTELDGKVRERLSPPDKVAKAPRVEDIAAFAEGRDLPPDMWDRFGVRWTCKGKRRDPYRDVLLWESVQPIGGGSCRVATLTGEELEERGPFTSKSPLAEDQEPDPNAGKDTDPVNPDHEPYQPGDLSKRIRQLEADNAALRRRLSDWAEAVNEWKDRAVVAERKLRELRNIVSDVDVRSDDA